MRGLLQLLRLCLATSSLVGSLALGDEPVPLPEPDPIVVPSIRLPMLPNPSGPPAPQPVTVLTEEHWYIVESDVPLLVLASPTGLVSVTPESGPLRIKGKFADGAGKVETRTYAGKYLFTVEAVARGTVELLIVPAGAVDESTVLRRTLSVMGPRPPPVPIPIPPDPIPIPDPIDPPLPPGPVTSFRVIFVKESGSTLTAEQTAIPGAKVIRGYLTAKTTPEGGLAGWREYDPQQNTANEQPTMKALWAAVKPKIQAVPCMVVEVNGHATVMPFPANTAEALSTLQKNGGA